MTIIAVSRPRASCDGSTSMFFMIVAATSTSPYGQNKIPNGCCSRLGRFQEFPNFERMGVQDNLHTCGGQLVIVCKGSVAVRYPNLIYAMFDRQSTDCCKPESGRLRKVMLGFERS